MILQIRNSRIGKIGSVFMIFIFLGTLNPLGSYALTGGPAQPEFNSFTPIGTSDMVDLASGDFSYNIPLMDVGGFPINLAYNSGVTMDQEASWVGLGWDLSIGQINRQMRGLPDDFEGDEVLYENNIKDNWTVGGSFQFSPELFGFDGGGGVSISGGVTGKYNSYAGYSFNPSTGISYEMASGNSVGLNVSSSPDGLVLSPSVTLSATKSEADKFESSVQSTIGVSFNSRQGLGSVNMSTSMKNSNFEKNEDGKTSTTNRFKHSVGSSISFVQNTYTPSVQTNMMTESGTFNAAIDLTVFGLKGEAEITGFGSNQYISNKTDLRQTYGYENTEKAPVDAVLDFNREKDGTFSVNSANLPLTNYTYDIYSVQGQGVSGMFHPYRSQVGYVYDNKMTANSSDISGGVEIGAGWNVDFGADIETTESTSYSGLWQEKNQAWKNEDEEDEMVFEERKTGEPNDKPNYEEVYYKNVGDLSADKNDEIYNYDNEGEEDEGKLGGYDPIRLKFGYVPYARVLKPTYLEKGEHELNFDSEVPYAHTSDGYEIEKADIKRNQRAKRNQTILKVTQKEAAALGSKTFEVNPNGKPYHTAGYIITRNDGARYNYGKALYNIKKQEVTFALGKAIGGATSSESSGIGNVGTGLVSYDAGTDNSLENTKGDYYFNRITTPAYGHTFLLTSLVSSDYSDTDEELGPSKGDFGSYTKFEYVDKGNYQWRVPYQKDQANFNEGLKTDPTDDKGSYIYGVKELSYIQKIETKTHVAIFEISERHDAHGVDDENGSDEHENTSSKMYQLDEIRLYSIGEYYDESGVTVDPGAIPIKTAHFVYDYSLCLGIVNNDQEDYDGDGDGISDDNQGGKLTLKKVYFTYRNSGMGKYSAYDFAYGDTNHDGEFSEKEIEYRNPEYNLKAYDVWGCYKNNGLFADGEGTDPVSELSAPEFNYVEQNDFYEIDVDGETEVRDKINDYTAAWSLTDISLPSGGQIQIDYESDDYQFVQDKKVMRMFKLAGAGKTANPAHNDDFTFDPGIGSDFDDQDPKEALLFKGANKEAEYLYFELDAADQSGVISDLDYREKYLNRIYEGQKGLLQFRMLMNMTPKGGVNKSSWKKHPFDYVSGYCELGEIDSATTFNQIVDGEPKYYGSVPIRLVNIEGGIGGALDNVNPISKAGWQFARRYLGQYVYGMPMLEDGTAVGAALESVAQSMENFAELAMGANALLRTKKISKRFIPEKSWIRLCEPTNHKKGGGCRVKQIAMTDEWEEMSGSDEGAYLGQKYGQEYVYEMSNGSSSGVATYEPVGSKENPLVQPVFVNVNRLLAPDDQNYTEKPFGESFFPNPKVTYRKVTVKNLERRNEGEGKRVTKHATGKVVTEFFTSKDYPTITDQTTIRLKEDANPILAAVFSLNVVKHYTASQGYVVHANDMNGKMKSQWVYAEGQDEPISGVEYKYDLNNPETPSPQFGNQGRLDNKVMTLDPNGLVKERRIGVEQNIINDFREMKSKTIVAGVDFQTNTFAIGPIVTPVPSLFPKFSRHVTKLNIATTTKVVNTFGILRETIAYDVGAAVSTRNKLWDTETGEVLLTETVNEYDKRYYSFNFPAYWNYEGMGQAAFNSGLTLPMINLGGGSYSILATGYAQDYLALGDEVIIPVGDGFERAWVTNIVDEDIYFNLIDAAGEPLALVAEELRVIRSGRRNLQSTSMGSIVMQRGPFDLFINNGDGTYTFNTDKLSVINDPTLPEGHGNHWETNRIVNAGAVEFKEDWDLPCECGIDGENEVYNQYRYNMLGLWRAYKSHLYLTGREQADDANPREDGFYKSYNSFYTNASGDWNINSDNWTYTSEVTGYSPYGFELENADALGRYSAAQYGYNFSFPLAVGANSEYAEMGFDGFEDYSFKSCQYNEHFGFRGNVPGDPEDMDDEGITNAKSHTGKFSMKVKGGTAVKTGFKYGCE